MPLSHGLQKGIVGTSVGDHVGLGWLPCHAMPLSHGLQKGIGGNSVGDYIGLDALLCH